MKAMPIKLSLPWTLAVCISMLAILGTQPAAAQSLIDGYWNPTFNQDSYAFLAGPDAGDFAGIPVTAAAVTLGHTWDAQQLALPALQCWQYAATYGPRGPSLLRIWEDRDPFTQQQTRIETWAVFAAMHRVIWMVPHPHPPPWALDSWQGYSTGKWVGNVLWVHTDKLKPFLTRNGQPLDDRAALDERFFRYGDVLTDVQMISDPQYLSRPYVVSKIYSRVPQGAMSPYQCTPNDETHMPAGFVPMHLPGNGKLFIDGPVLRGIPVQAAAGGAATMFPEYQDYIRALPRNPPVAQIEKAEQAANAEEQKAAAQP